jgi:hypothetical protein
MAFDRIGMTALTRILRLPFYHGVPDLRVCPAAFMAIEAAHLGLQVHIRFVAFGE